jgi:hypothetical protein
MPLLYGEGAKAFQRLQAEIIGQGVADQSLLMWWETPKNLDPHKNVFLPALTSSTAAFTKSGTVERLGRPKMSWGSEGLSTSVYMLGILNLIYSLRYLVAGNQNPWDGERRKRTYGFHCYVAGSQTTLAGYCTPPTGLSCHGEKYRKRQPKIIVVFSS